ncbi:uncharacterized protein LOC114304245 [Camellia sinensis]|uniref:uncharacterized protein LOC114304245 n=1 Tax=Camellia sinensis TaxID=4442 RepID=UPI00103585B6|nr:uncharacterized protein LOC114304245 [Camellia sinensis]
MFTHLLSPSTSLASQRNWPTHANSLLHETRNIGVVIRDECNLNIIRNSKAKEKEKAKAMSKGKEKATSFDKWKENACPMDWVKKYMELKNINTTRLLRWGCNKIVVHVPHWGYI